MDTLELIQSLLSLKTNGHMVTTVYLDLSTTEKLRSAEIVLNNLFKHKKEKTFYKNLSDTKVPPGAGQVILANCTNIVVEDQQLSSGNVGILIGYSSYNDIRNNTCFNNSQSGIFICF